MQRTATGIDWAAYEERAKGMTDAELREAVRDCFKTARVWDASHDEHDNGGAYRDEGSVYMQELKRRA